MSGAILRSTHAQFVVAAYLAGAVACAFLPLADHLGFEFAALLTLVAAVSAPALGFAAVRLESQLPPDARRPARAATRAGVLAVLLLVLPTIVILTNGLRRPTCDPLAGSVWLVVLTAPSAWLAATAGAAARAAFRRALPAIAVLAVVMGGSVLVNGALVHWGPAYYALNHFFGYFPGPIYDETILFSPALVTFRIATVLWGVAMALATEGFARGLGRPRRALFASGVVLAGGLAGLTIGWGTDLNWRTTNRSLAEEFGTALTVDRLVLHYPRNWSERSVDELVRDATFDAHEVQHALGLDAREPVHVWIYGGASDKRRLVGAAGTSFAKPWQHAVHLNAYGFPNPVLRHELVHAFGGEVSGGPWRVPGGWFPNNALIEGFAEAYDVDENEDRTLMERARSMRDVKLAPDLHVLLTPKGFNTEASSRAYTYAGAFVQFLRGRFTPAQMRELYRTGDLGPLGGTDALVRDFERALDAVHADLPMRATARRAFSQPGLTRRVCAREVNAMMVEASRLAINRRWDEAFATYDRACALQPQNPALVRVKLNLALGSPSLDSARIRAIADELFRHPALDPALEASARLDVGDYLWRRGDTTGARAMYQKSAAIPSDPSTTRGQVVRLRAMADPRLRTLLEPFIAEGRSGLDQLFRMTDAIAAAPDNVLVGYLLGRQLALRGAEDRGADLLERAEKAGLNDRELTREALRVVVRARAARHECDAAERARTRLAAPGSAADDQSAANRVARCRFEVERGWKPLS